MRVLLAENNIANGLVARSILMRDGHMVRVARNGAETIELALRDSYDVILLDIMMPVLDGLQTAREFRRSGNRLTDHEPRLFALTAYDSADHIAKYWDVGFDGIISKPLRSGDLANAYRISMKGAVPMLNCRSDVWVGESGLPLLNMDVILNGPGQADELTKNRILKSYREGLAQSLREISYALPGSVARKHDDLDRLKAALHSLRSAALMVGMDRAPQLAGKLRHVPEDTLIDDIADLLRAVRDSLPLLENALSKSARF